MDDYSQPRYFDKAAMLAQLAEDRAETERTMAEREVWLQTHYVPDRRPPEPEPPPRTAVPQRDGRQMPAWLALQNRDQIRDEVSNQVREQIKAALRSEEKGGLAEQFGWVLARERAQFRKITDALQAEIATLKQDNAVQAARIAVLEAERAAPLLDLTAERDERRRRIQ